MTDRSPRPRRWLAAAASSVLLALSACGAGDAPPEEEDAPLESPGPEVDGGAVGPDEAVTEDVSLQQVQLEYPLDGVHDEGEDASLFFAVTTPAPIRSSSPTSAARTSAVSRW